MKLMDVFTSSKNYGHVAFNRAKEGTTRAVIFFILMIIAVGAFANPYNTFGCSGCHGANGISNAPTTPNLAGQKSAYIVLALKDYQNGNRNNATMKAMAEMSKGKEEEIAKFVEGL